MSPRVFGVRCPRRFILRSPLPRARSGTRSGSRRKEIRFGISLRRETGADGNVGKPVIFPSVILLSGTRPFCVEKKIGARPLRTLNIQKRLSFPKGSRKFPFPRETRGRFGETAAGRRAKSDGTPRETAVSFQRPLIPGRAAEGLLHAPLPRRRPGKHTKSPFGPGANERRSENNNDKKKGRKKCRSLCSSARLAKLFGTLFVRLP